MMAMRAAANAVGNSMAVGSNISQRTDRLLPKASLVALQARAKRGNAAIREIKAATPRQEAVVTRRGIFVIQAGHPNAPHVHENDQWMRHDSGRNDPHYHVNQPFAHARFPGGIGREHQYRLAGAVRSACFLVIINGALRPMIWAMLAIGFGFCCIYNDPDHVGWYLASNVRLGTYVHVMYLS